MFSMQAPVHFFLCWTTYRQRGGGERPIIKKSSVASPFRSFSFFSVSGHGRPCCWATITYLVVLCQLSTLCCHHNRFGTNLEPRGIPWLGQVGLTFVDLRMDWRSLHRQLQRPDCQLQKSGSKRQLGPKHETDPSKLCGRPASRQ
jgi:hypothetical protein